MVVGRFGVELCAFPCRAGGGGEDETCLPREMGLLGAGDGGGVLLLSLILVGVRSLLVFRFCFFSFSEVVLWGVCSLDCDFPDGGTSMVCVF